MLKLIPEGFTAGDTLYRDFEFERAYPGCISVTADTMVRAGKYAWHTFWLRLYVIMYCVK
jgi:hypothetical protein